MKMSKTTISFLAAGFFVLATASSCSTIKQMTEKITKKNPAKTEQPTVVTESENDADDARDIRRPGGDRMASTMPIRGAVIVNLDSVQNQLNGEWIVMTVNGQEVTGDDDRPYINIDSKEQRFYCSNGCNLLNGAVEVDGPGKVKFTGVMSTMKACPDSRFEQAINLALDATESFSIETVDQASTLALRNNQGTMVMTLRRRDMSYINGAWQVVKIDGKTVDNPEVKLVIDLPEERIHGNTGCNILNGKIFLDPDKTGDVQFQQIITTRMACPDNQWETRLLVALESAEHASLSTLNGKPVVVLSDSNNHEVMVLSSIPMSEME